MQPHQPAGRPPGLPLSCPACGAQNAPGAMYCAACGTVLGSPQPLPQQPPPQPELPLGDPAAGFTAPPAPPAPPAPGVPEAPPLPVTLPPPPVSPPVQAPVPPPAAAPAVPPVPPQAADAPGGVDADPTAAMSTAEVCPACAAPVHAGAPFCGNCGTELAPAPAQGGPVAELLGPDGLHHAVSGVVTIGRDEQNSFPIADPAISRAHCRLETRGDTVLLSDLNSTNGTWVNGRRVQHEELTDGDRVLVGRTELVFRSLRAQPPPPPQQVPSGLPPQGFPPPDLPQQGFAATEPPPPGPPGPPRPPGGMMPPEG